MNLIDYYGLLAVAFIIGSLGALIFRSVKIKILVAVLLTSIFLYPFGENRISLAMRILAAIDTPSLSLVILAVGNICRVKKMFRFGIPLAALIIGSVLYLTEMGLIRYDLYSWGYDYKIIVAIVCISIIFLNIKEICILLSGIFLFRFGYYSNFFDVFLDPVFFCWSLVYVLLEINRYFKKKKISNNIRNEDNLVEENKVNQ